MNEGFDSVYDSFMHVLNEAEKYDKGVTYQKLVPETENIVKSYLEVEIPVQLKTTTQWYQSAFQHPM